MILTNRKLLIGNIIILICLLSGYIFFERYITEEEIIITVINSEKFGDETGNFLIFTRDEVFLDENNYFHNKYNAREVFRELKKGKTYKVQVVSFYWPLIPHFRNIVKVIKEENSV